LIDEETYRKFKVGLPSLRDRAQLLADQGEEDRAEEMRDGIEQLEKQIRTYEIKKRKRGNQALNKVAKWVRKYLDRARETLQASGLTRLADHLATAFRTEYRGVTSLPSGQTPAWTL